MYEPRFYREQGNKKLKRFNVCYKETDLVIYAPVVLSELCFAKVRKLRLRLEEYIAADPIFARTLAPLAVAETIYDEIKEMAEKSARVGVGPMAAVAGLFAEAVGKEILKRTGQVIVENGGDIFIKLEEDCKIAVYAGEQSPFKDRLAIKLKAEQMPLGVCSSSGMMGPSLSKGKADLVTVISPSTVLADAAATAIANKIQQKEDLTIALNWAKRIEGISGLLVIKDDGIGVWGSLKLIRR
jgi:ApbE superfamily uncharacterized protein (UPF0280 family)